MKETWEMAFAKLIEHEGGFTDDPRDPGNSLPDGRPGCTNLGVTQKAWEEYVGHQVTHDDMKQLTRESVKPFYKKHYWDVLKADELPLGIDYMVFDMGVNSGWPKAAMTLQQAVGAKPDGAIGPKTIEAVKSLDAEKLIDDFSEKRLDFMRNLSTWPVHGKGWERRVDEVAEMATKLSQTS
jgi:lysozyme family protein